MDKRKIPKGIYCYDDKGTCPYWSMDEEKPQQESGYCRFMGVGDWEEKGTWLLWDMVKECGINEE